MKTKNVAPNPIFSESHSVRFGVRLRLPSISFSLKKNECSCSDSLRHHNKHRVELYCVPSCHYDTKETPTASRAVVLSNKGSERFIEAQ